MLAEKGAACPVLEGGSAANADKYGRPGYSPVHRQSRLSRMPVQILQSADFQCKCSPFCGSSGGLLLTYHSLWSHCYTFITTSGFARVCYNPVCRPCKQLTGARVDDVERKDCYCIQYCL